MSNTIEIVVEGKNEATKVFSAIESDATSSARKTEQSWGKAMTTVNEDIQRGGLGATAAGEGFDRLGKSAKASGDATRKMGDDADHGAEKLGRVGEASDEVDTKAMGFRDTVTGVSDTLKGMNDASLSTEQRLLTLGAGIGDLGSAGYNLLVPAMSKARQVFKDLGDESSALRGKLAGAKGGLIAAGAATAILAAGMAGATALTEHKISKPVDVLTASLTSFSQTGKTSGSAAELLGGNLDKLKVAFENTHLGGIQKFAAGMVEMLPPIANMDDSVSSSRERINNLDQALAQLAQKSPAEASAAFSKLTQDMGLSYQQVNQFKDQLPAFSNAMQQSANAANDSAQSQERNAQALSDYLTQLQSATDPVFNLLNSINQVSTAQKDYNEAVKQHGIHSNEAKDASVALAEAVAGAEAAALNGQLSYNDFSVALDHWVSSGVITAQQAASIRDRVNEAHGAANAYTGNYDASLFMENHASGVIAQVQRDLNAVPDSTYKKFYMTYIQQIIGNAPPQESYFLGGGHATGGPVGHAATGGGRSGMTWVGENGPELVKLPAGSFVNPAGASSQSQAGGGVTEVRLVLDITGGDQKMRDMIRNWVKVDGGGNVQTAFGN